MNRMAARGARHLDGEGPAGRDVTDCVLPDAKSKLDQ